MAGGGRILGEVCHFIDLMQYVCDADPVAVSAMCIETPNREVKADDNVVISLRFADGSVGSIGYFAEGANRCRRNSSRYSAPVAAACWRISSRCACGRAGQPPRALQRQGHADEVKAFLDAIGNGKAPISWRSQLATTLATLRVLDALGSGRTEAVDVDALLREAAGGNELNRRRSSFGPSPCGSGGTRPTPVLPGPIRTMA